MTLHLALLQMTSNDDIENNLSNIRNWAKIASQEGCNIIALPEGCTYIGSDNEKFNVAKKCFTEIIPELKDIALKNNIWIVAGGIPEPKENTKTVYNTAFVINEKGDLIAFYRKIHLFDASLSKNDSYHESYFVSSGESIVSFKTPWGIFGLSICYDLRFPELYRDLAHAGARLIFVPAAFTMITGKDHWHTLLKARAIENTVYIAAPAQIGNHGNNRISYGRSLIVNPWGNVILESEDKCGIITKKIDLAYVDEIRNKIPSLKERKLAYNSVQNG